MHKQPQLHENPLVHQLVGLLDNILEESEADFGGQHWHSLVWNLHNVSTEELDATRVRGDRTIRDIVKHIGMCFLMYEDSVFGTGTRNWGELEFNGVVPDGDTEQLIGWLRQTHEKFRNTVAELTDAQLTELSSWGAPWTNLRIIEVMTQHPLYHIGEINYARALLQGNNDWNHQDIGRDPQD